MRAMERSWKRQVFGVIVLMVLAIAIVVTLTVVMNRVQGKLAAPPVNATITLRP
jgi:hypothetical protein